MGRITTTIRQLQAGDIITASDLEDTEGVSIIGTAVLHVTLGDNCTSLALGTECGRTACLASYGAMDAPVEVIRN